ncbi:MAG: apolipoprotein A1/A4/E family protein [Verrucomicrobia bacterium]|nr:apolipoprotein A1/A4/E family protein [Verrucomicrobiota bacterium]
MSGDVQIHGNSWLSPARLWTSLPPSPSLGSIPSILKRGYSTATTTISYCLGKTLAIPRGISAAYSRGKEALRAVKESMNTHPEMFLRLYILIEEFDKKTTLKLHAREELAERLEDFIREFPLNTGEKKFIEEFCQKLRNSSVSFDASQRDDFLALRDILTPSMEKHSAYIISKIHERHALEQMQGVAIQPVDKPSKEKTVQGIEEQIDLLKANSLKLVLGSVILYSALGLKKVKDIPPEAKERIFAKIPNMAPINGEDDLTNLLIEASNKWEIPGKSSEEVFEMLLERVIDHSDKNIFTRYFAKAQCKSMFKLLSSYLTNLFDKLKSSLVYFAHLPPTEQLEQIIALLVSPLADHLMQTEQGYVDIAKDKKSLQGHHLRQTGSVSQLLSALLHQKTRGGESPDQLLDHFIEVFLNQFIDPIHQHWTRQARGYCLERASRSHFWGRWTFNTLAGLSWAAGKVIAPFQWTLNEAIRLTLRKTIVGLCPGLFGSTKNALGIGQAFSWHSLKKNLVTMLRQVRLSRFKPRDSNPYEPKPNVSDTTSQRFTQLVDQLLKVMLHQDRQSKGKDEHDAPLSFAIVDLLDLLIRKRSKLFINNGSDLKQLADILEKDEKDLINHVQYQLHDILKGTLSELVVNMCSQEGFFNDTILSSLVSTNANSFSPQSVVVSDEEKARVENEWQQELALLGENILKDLKTSTADKRDQTAANVYVNTLKSQVKAYQQKFSELQRSPTPPSLADFKSVYTQLVQSMEDLKKKIHANVDASTEALLDPYITHCLSEARQGLRILEQHTKIKDVLDNLGMHLQNPLESEEEILKTLQTLRAINPSTAAELEAEQRRLMQTFERRLSESRTAGKEKHPKAHFQGLIDKYKKALHQEKKHRIQWCNHHLASLADWASKLSYVKVTTKPSLQDAGLALVYETPLAKAAAANLLQSYGNNFFHLIGQECHIDGIVQRVMKAYIQKSPMRRQPALRPLPQRVRRALQGPNFQRLTAVDWAILSI